MRWPLVFLAGVCALTARRVTIHDRSTLPIAAHAASPVHLSSPVHHSARSAVPVCAVTAARAARNPKPHWEQKKATTVCWPQWPQLTTKTSEFDTLLKSFVNVTSTVPLRASESPTDEWREWSDGGFAAVKVVAAKLNRDRYMSVLACLRELVVRSQANCPELYAVLKFVPKKNGLNPLLAQLGDWDGGGPAVDVPEELRLEGLKPREIRRRLDDLSRAFEQSWLLTSTYLSLPNKGLRDDFLWSARTVVEKIKTDQRSRALELLCLGVFHRDAKLFALVSGGGGGGGGGKGPWARGRPSAHKAHHPEGFREALWGRCVASEAHQREDDLATLPDDLSVSRGGVSFMARKKARGESGRRSRKERRRRRPGCECGESGRRRRGGRGGHRAAVG